MDDRDLLIECMKFLEDMHVLPAVVTIEDSQVLHAKVAAHLAASPKLSKETIRDFNLRYAPPRAAFP